MCCHRAVSFQVSFRWHRRQPKRAWWRAARCRSRRSETDRRHSCNVFPASSRFPATMCPPVGSEEMEVSPTGGGRPADTGSISRNSASSFVYNGHEARTISTTIVHACTHARTHARGTTVLTSADAQWCLSRDAMPIKRKSDVDRESRRNPLISHQDLLSLHRFLFLQTPSFKEIMVRNYTARLSVRYIHYLYFIHIYFYILYFIHLKENFHDYSSKFIFSLFLNLNFSRAAAVYKTYFVPFNILFFD